LIGVIGDRRRNRIDGGGASAAVIAIGFMRERATA